MATPRAVPKRSGSSRGKWFFTGVLQIQETIPLQILDPFAELFEVGHTLSAHGSKAQIVAWIDERSVAQESLSRRLQLICAPSLPRLITMAGIDTRRSAFQFHRIQPCEAPLALCDSPHGVNERCPYTRTTLREAAVFPCRCRRSELAIPGFGPRTDMPWPPGDVRFWGKADMADLRVHALV
jgi:hypothetical protein